LRIFHTRGRVNAADHTGLVRYTHDTHGGSPALRAGSRLRLLYTFAPKVRRRDGLTFFALLGMGKINVWQCLEGGVVMCPTLDLLLIGVFLAEMGISVHDA
jgi:hypothetical protein